MKIKPFGILSKTSFDRVNALNDMEIYDKYDTLMVSMPPRVGKSVTNLRFISWIMGRKPTHTQLAISYSDAITKIILCWCNGDYNQSRIHRCISK